MPHRHRNRRSRTIWSELIESPLKRCGSYGFYGDAARLLGRLLRFLYGFYRLGIGGRDKNAQHQAWLACIHKVFDGIPAEYEPRYSE